MDMSVQLRAASGAICSLSLSFNNDGPFGSTYRYICDEGAFVARYDALSDGWGKPIDVSEPGVSGDGLELQDRAFFAAVRQRREPEASVAQVLPAYRVLDRLARDLEADQNGLR
jgi:2-hydroxy-4-carboxymuconate semialdehyde hemiacetal dehydrogenase